MEEFEPPKYIEKLIAAINDGAKSAQLGALAFTAIGLFLLATAFSATDEDLLLNRALTISQLGGTAVPVVFAFGLAPAVFVAAHFYTLIRYDMLAENVRQFRDDLAAMAMSEADRRRCRQLLANVEFVNALAMPKGSRASSWMFAGTVRALLAVFPVAVLLFVQLQSLRLQSEWVNWTHHACIAADLVLLVWFFGRLRGDDTWHFGTAPIRRKAALWWMPMTVLAVDLAWLKVPGPTSETVSSNLAAYLHQYPGGGAPLMRQVEWLVAFNPVDLLLCTPGTWGCRFLTVTHRIIVAKVWGATTFVALRAGADVDEKHRASFEPVSLRGRTLRFANLRTSELFSADLTDTDLQHAVLIAATLKRADLSGAQLQGANLSGAQLQGANLGKAGLQGANLSWAQLQGARLQQAQLQGADLTRAQLQGADLRVAGLWNSSGNGGTQLGLADLRGAKFDPVSAEDLLADLPASIPEAVTQLLRKRLAPPAVPPPHDPASGHRAAAGWGVVNTAEGKILVPDLDAWRGVNRTTQPADIDPALAELLANTVAPTAPQAAEAVARRVISPDDEDRQRPLIKLLGCRLQEQVDAKRVTLKTVTIEDLRKASGPCDQPSP